MWIIIYYILFVFIKLTYSIKYYKPRLKLLAK